MGVGEWVLGVGCWVLGGRGDRRRLFCQLDEFGVLPADLDDGADLRADVPDAGADGDDLVDVGGAEDVGGEPGAGPGEGQGGHAPGAVLRPDLGQQGQAGLQGPAAVAHVARRRHAASVVQDGKFATDRSDVETDVDPGGSVAA